MSLEMANQPVAGSSVAKKGRAANRKMLSLKLMQQAENTLSVRLNAPLSRALVIAQLGLLIGLLTLSQYANTKRINLLSNSTIVGSDAPRSAFSG